MARPSPLTVPPEMAGNAASGSDSEPDAFCLPAEYTCEPKGSRVMKVPAMNATVRTTLLAIVSVVGLLVSFLVLNIALVSIQGMSGDEPFSRMLLFFSVAFALAFGLAAACGLPWLGAYTPWTAGRAFATAGAIGGAVHAFALKLLTDFEPQLRALTNGGPLGLFALGASLAALAITLVLGRALLPRASSR